MGKPCPHGKFCVNSEGSHRCVKCAEGYSLKDNNFCVVDKTNTGKLFNIDNTRFFTYAGLVVATCIILHKNWLVASGVGVVVAAYISFTEYYLANNDIRNFVIHETFTIFF